MADDVVMVTADDALFDSPIGSSLDPPQRQGSMYTAFEAYVESQRITDPEARKFFGDAFMAAAAASMAASMVPTPAGAVAPTVAPTMGPAVGASLNERRLALVERRWQLQRDVRELAKASQVVDQVRYGSHLWLPSMAHSVAHASDPRLRSTPQIH